MSTAYDVVVIGGGHNGLTAATLLAKAGRKVAVVERRNVLGGLAAGEEFADGYRTTGLLHDTAAVRRSIVEELGLAEHGLEFVDQGAGEGTGQGACFVPQRPGDGDGLLLPLDSAADPSELDSHSPGNAKAYSGYRDFLHRIGPWVRRLLDAEPPDLFRPGTRDLIRLGRSALGLRRLGKKDMMEVLRILPMCTADWLGEWFESDLLKAGLAAPALYDTGLGPRAPATNTNLILGEVSRDSRIRGGPQALVESLARASRAAGVDIFTGHGVRSIDTAGGRVAAITIDDGERIEAAVVAASCDPKHLFFDLVRPERVPRKLLLHLRNYRSRGAIAKVHLALDGLPDFACRPGLEAARIRVGPTVDDLERASDAIKYRQFSGVPALDIHIPTLEVSGLAPEGHHVLSILVHCAPFALDGGWTPESTEDLCDAVITTLESYAPRLRDQIIAKEVLNPSALATRYGLTEGHLFHGEAGLDQILVRPTPECARYRTPIEDLFLCGSGSHPGGGITCAPGALGAKAILRST